MERKSHQSLRFQSITSLYQILRRKQTISMIFSHLNVLQFLMIVLYPIHQIQFLMLVYHPFISKIWIFLRLYAPLTTTKFLFMILYIYIYISIYIYTYIYIYIRLLKICDSSIVRPLSIIFKNGLQTGTFLSNFKKSNVVPIHKKVTNNYYKITAQSCCYQCEVKFSTQCFYSLKKIIFSVQTNRDFVPLTHVKASYYPLFMTSMLFLIKFLPLKSKQTSQIYPKHLIKYCMRGCYLSLSILEYQEIS